MPPWINFIHAPGENFAGTMTEAESEVWSRHWQRLMRLFSEGGLVMVGPTLGSTDMGLYIFEASDESSARRIMDEDPTIAEGFARGELRPFRISLLRGRDEGWVADELGAARD